MGENKIMMADCRFLRAITSLHMHIWVYNFVYVSVTAWVSCQFEHLAVCSQMDHVADGGHKQSQVTGLNTIKITLNVGVCVGVLTCYLCYCVCTVYVSMCRCYDKKINKRRSRNWFILQREKERGIELVRYLKTQRAQGGNKKNRVTIKESK